MTHPPHPATVAYRILARPPSCDRGVAVNVASPSDSAVVVTFPTLRAAG